MKISNPRQIAPGMINVDWYHPRLGLIEYTAIDQSGEAEMQSIWDGIKAGLYGKVREAQ